MAFTEWLEEHGARFSQLSFVHSARFGNHAVAVEEISGRNGPIVTLPRAFLMSPSAALSSLTAGKALQGELSGKTKTEGARHVGAEVARKAKEAGVEAVVFDRGLAKYTGRVQALAEAAREAGLKF